ncbi:MAG: glycosyltransferase [Clostridium perfringens]|nr:glycosyltransferase [Clostridium perfringens]
MSIKEKIKSILRPFIKSILTKMEEKKDIQYKNKFLEDLRNIIYKSKYDAIIIFDVYFGFNMKMFQRPQHIALNLSDENILYFYKSSPYIDKDIEICKKIKDNLYLINTDIYWVQEGLLDIIKESHIKAFAQIYSTSFTEYDKHVKKFLTRGFKIIYEFVDELSDDIAGFKLTENIKKSHRFMLEDVDNTYVIATADELYKEVKDIRGVEKLALIENGVDFNHFSSLKDKNIPKKMKDIVSLDKKIIGYFGALAKWFDYDLIKKISKEFHDINIVLIGVDYDKSLAKSGVLNLNNVYYIDAVEYKDLPNYARFFDVSMIPFIINDITKSTSPVKLFEYMALGKPIVTTNLPECRKYKSPLISKDHNEFIENIKEAIKLKEDYNYKLQLSIEGKENTWSKRARDMKKFILDS